MRPMRIASLLPSATEIVAALGLQDSLVGVTHECDFPRGVERLPHLTANMLDASMSSRQIDQAVSSSMKADAHTIYRLDAGLLKTLAPEIIFTQALCDVCAVPTSMVEDAVCSMPEGARIVSLDPLDLEAVIDAIEQAAGALDVPNRGRETARELRARINAVRSAVRGAPRRTVLAAEWLDPVYCGGHWVPEMIAIAGGQDEFGAPAERSHPVTWADIAATDPEVIVLMPCGFDSHGVIERYGEIASAPEWQSLRAVRAREVYAVDATAYYSRPGPRLVEGTEILARILHPERCAELPLPNGAAFRLATDGSFESLT